MGAAVAAAAGDDEDDTRVSQLQSTAVTLSSMIASVLCNCRSIRSPAVPLLPVLVCNAISSRILCYSVMGLDTDWHLYSDL